MLFHHSTFRYEVWRLSPIATQELIVCTKLIVSSCWTSHILSNVRVRTTSTADSSKTSARGYSISNSYHYIRYKIILHIIHLSTHSRQNFHLYQPLLRFFSAFLAPFMLFLGLTPGFLGLLSTFNHAFMGLLVATNLPSGV